MWQGKARQDRAGGLGQCLVCLGWRRAKHGRAGRGRKGITRPAGPRTNSLMDKVFLR